MSNIPPSYAPSDDVLPDLPGEEDDPIETAEQLLLYLLAKQTRCPGTAMFVGAHPKMCDNLRRGWYGPYAATEYAMLLQRSEAIGVIKGWKRAEPLIKQDYKAAKDYAYYVLFRAEEQAHEWARVAPNTDKYFQQRGK